MPLDIRLWYQWPAIDITRLNQVWVTLDTLDFGHLHIVLLSFDVCVGDNIGH